MTDVASEETGDDWAVLNAVTAMAPVFHFARWPVNADDWSWRLRFDPVFAAEMSLCREYGIPHSAFLDWDDVDRAKAIAFHLHEARRCRDCGVHPDDWDPVTYPPPFEIATRTCAGCQELAQFNRHAQKEADKAPSMADGVKPYLRRTTEG